MRSSLRYPTRPEIPDVPRAPWSEIGPGFIRDWGRPNGRTEPEHLEVLGPSGSGKSLFTVCILKQRVAAKNSGCVFIATKPADSTIRKLGWEVTQDWRGVQQHPQVVFWPRTRALGTKRKAYQAAKIQELLDRLWVPDSNNIVVWDEIAYIERLSPELRDTVDMYLREARSQGITLVMGKQRPQGVTREMHAETSWAVSFKPADHNDAERSAELFGSKKEWTPILESLNPEKHEFLVQYRKTGASYISWIDKKPPRSPSGKPNGAATVRRTHS